MTYISSTNLEQRIGTRNYNMLLAADGGTTADSTILSAVLTMVDEEIDFYSTSFTTAQKKRLAYDIAEYRCYCRKGPGNVPVHVSDQYKSAIDMLKSRMAPGISLMYDPSELMTTDREDDLMEDLQ